ncbi:MAG: DegT/DnrJ/EryC1/StrS family aminotransferase [Gaiellaceae bacterium]
MPSEPSTRARPLSVGFLELRHVHEDLKAEILEDISRLIDANAFTNGPQVREFERAFAEWCGSRECVGLASGLDALRLAFLAAGIEPGDEVILPANTFIATFEAVTQAGGRPVPVDVGESDYNLDVGAVEAAITARTRFLLPVHLYGQMADMHGLAALAERQGLRIVEDACQAHGATRDDLVSGAVGLAGAFSFYPGKNLGAMGDAGALVTDDEDLAAKMRALREHGQREKYRHELEGYTARLDTVQALVLLHKLPHLERWNEERRSVAGAYTSALEGIGDLGLPPVPEGSDPVWHLYVVRTAAPERLAAFLGERGIGSGRHYPEPAHLSPAYAWLGYESGAFPVTERLASELLSLPIFPGMSEEQVDAVVRAISEYFGRG